MVLVEPGLTTDPLLLSLFGQLGMDVGAMLVVNPLTMLQNAMLGGLTLTALGWFG